MAIVAMLATLLLGPAGKALSSARAMQWADKARFMTGEISARLNSIFAGQTSFPLVTLDQLEQDNVLTTSQAGFLRDSRVRMTPFAGNDPDTLVVIHVTLKRGFLTDAGALTVTKGEITAVPK